MDRGKGLLANQICTSHQIYTKVNSRLSFHEKRSEESSLKKLTWIQESVELH